MIATAEALEAAGKLINIGRSGTPIVPLSRLGTPRMPR